LVSKLNVNVFYIAVRRMNAASEVYSPLGQRDATVVFVALVF